MGVLRSYIEWNGAWASWDIVIINWLYRLLTLLEGIIEIIPICNMYYKEQCNNYTELHTELLQNLIAYFNFGT